MTGEVPYTVLVMINDEHSAGRIVVELDALVRFNLDMDRQLKGLETRLQKWMPRRPWRSNPPRRTKGD